MSSKEFNTLMVNTQTVWMLYWFKEYSLQCEGCKVSE